ncbi:MAG: hypothetical protein ACJ8GN_11400 [Longimicrobiaceae bacterium]
MIVLGTNVYPARGAAAERQARAVAALAALPGVLAVNVTWPDEAVEVEGMRTVPALRRDSVEVTGRPGPRKPLITDLLDVLAGIAEREGADRFGFANSDIAVTPAAVEHARGSGAPALAFVRVDVEGPGGGVVGYSAGTDVVVFSLPFWRRHRRRFRPYLVGEPVWDFVYAALIAGAGGEIVSRLPLVVHEAHPQAWHGSPFAEYTRVLAALDRPLFARYMHYLAALERAGPALTQAEALLIQRAVFGARPSPGARVLQLARAAAAVARYAARRAAAAAGR